MKSKIISLMMLLFLLSCDDIIEKDISGEEVALKAPGEGFVTSSSEILFWWEPVNGADRYNLLVVSPDLENPVLVALDSTTLATRLTVELPEGSYQWCIKGINSAYATAYSCRSLEVTN